MLNNLGKKVPINAEYRFKMLINYCKEEGGLPRLWNYVYNNVNISYILKRLLEGKYYKNERNQWIEQLKSVSPEIKTECEERLENINDFRKKKSREIKLKKRFQMLLSYCKEENKLPQSSYMHNNINIGDFLNDLLRGKFYGNKQDQWIEQLKDISLEIKIEFGKRLKKESRVMQLKERFQILLNYCKDENKLPQSEDIYNNINIGDFLNDLLGGKCYKNKRNRWIEQLKSLSLKIKIEFEKRLENINNIKKKESREKKLKESREMKLKERFQMLLIYCKEENKLPLRSSTYNNIKIGIFLNNLLGVIFYGGKPGQLIEQLKKVSPEIKIELEKRLKNIKILERKASRVIQPEERFQTLLDYCKEENKLPVLKCTHDGIKIGNFFWSLLKGKYYKNKRNQWIEQLKGISPEIKIKCEKRLKNINNLEKRASRVIKPDERFQMLLNYCKEENKLPIQIYIYNNIKVGKFLRALLEGKWYKNERDEWIEQLKSISPKIKIELEKRLKKRNNLERKASRVIQPEERFQTLLNYCKEENKLPLHIFIYNGIKIGNFLTCLLGAKVYKNERDQWLEQLKSISSEIKIELEKRLENINNLEKKASRSIKPEERFQTLLDYCKEENELPVLKCTHDGIKIGNFLSNLLGGKVYKNERSQWLEQLKNVSPEIKIELDKRSINSEYRFQMLISYCKKENKLPLRSSTYNNINVGNFLVSLLGKKSYKNERDQWIEQLKKVSPEIKIELEKRTENKKCDSSIFACLSKIHNTQY